MGKGLGKPDEASMRRRRDQRVLAESPPIEQTLSSGARGARRRHTLREIWSVEVQRAIDGAGGMPSLVSIKHLGSDKLAQRRTDRLPVHVR